MFDKLIDFQIKNAKILALIFIFIVAFFSTHAVDLEIDPSFSVLIDPLSDFNTNERKISNTFETNNAYSILFELDETSSLNSRPTSLDTPEMRDYAETVRSVVLESQYAVSVSPLEVSDDGNYARMIVGVQEPRSVEGINLVLDELEHKLDEAGSIPGVDASLSGFSQLLNRVNTLLIQDNLVAILFTLVAIGAVLFWYFRSIRYTLLALIIPMSCVIVLAGTMVLLDIPLTITLAAVGIIMLGLGVDYTIHVLLAYDKYIAHNSKEKSIHKAVDYLAKAIFVSYGTTAAGFAALIFGISPSSQSQGVVLAIGITIIFVTTVFSLPSLLYLLGKDKQTVESNFFKNIKKQVIKLSQYQTVHPKKVLVIIGLITLVMALGATNVGISTDNNNWIPDDDPVSDNFRSTAIIFGADFGTLDIILEAETGDFRDVEKVKDIQRLENVLSSHKDINSVESALTNVSLQKSDIIERVNERSDDFNKDYTFTQIRVTADNFGGEEDGQSDLFDEIEEMVDEYSIVDTRTSFFGDTVRFTELGISLGRDTGITTVISLFFVFLLASIAYASLTVGIVALLPVVIGIVWTVGLKGFLGVPFTPLSTGLIALVLGIGVDFSIHLVNSIYKNLADNQSIKTALSNTLNYTGTPILLSSITTFIGFSSLLLASLLGIQRLGISLALSILSVFLVTIIMVPAIISLQVKNKKVEI